MDRMSAYRLGSHDQIDQAENTHALLCTVYKGVATGFIAYIDSQPSLVSEGLVSSQGSHPLGPRPLPAKGWELGVRIIIIVHNEYTR